MAMLERASERLDLMQRTRVVAIVGMSATPSRASHFVATYLAGRSDWTVHYVNPTLDEVLGQPVFPSLAALPEPPDIVDVFRRHDDLPGVAEEAIDAGAARLG